MFKLNICVWQGVYDARLPAPAIEIFNPIVKAAGNGRPAFTPGGGEHFIADGKGVISNNKGTDTLKLR